MLRSLVGSEMCIRDSTNSSGLQISNREVEAHIPWDDAGLAALNPEPNRGTSFLYDIWQVTYPNSENSYITDDGDLLHFERTVNPGTLIDTITRLNDRQLLIPAESVGVDFGLNLGDIVRVTYIFDGSSTQDTLIGEVSATGSAGMRSCRSFSRVIWSIRVPGLTVLSKCSKSPLSVM